MAKRNVITIGDKVRKARELKGLTQFQLAVEAGVRQDTVSRLELGKGNSTPASLFKIARVLGTTIDSLMDGTPVVRQQTADSGQLTASSKQNRGKTAT